jgi:hypothetical protein
MRNVTFIIPLYRNRLFNKVVQINSNNLATKNTFFCKILNYSIYFTKKKQITCCRWQLPGGLRHQMSSPASTLGSWFQIRHEDLCISELFLCLFYPDKVSALRRADPPSKEYKQIPVRLIVFRLNRPEDLICQIKNKKTFSLMP